LYTSDPYTINIICSKVLKLDCGSSLAVFCSAATKGCVSMSLEQVANHGRLKPNPLKKISLEKYCRYTNIG